MQNDGTAAELSTLLALARAKDKKKVHARVLGSLSSPRVKRLAQALVDQRAVKLSATEKKYLQGIQELAGVL